MCVNIVKISERDEFMVGLVQALKTTTEPMRPITLYREGETIIVADEVGTFLVTLVVNPGWHDVTVVEHHYDGHSLKEHERRTFKITALTEIVNVITTYLVKCDI